MRTVGWEVIVRFKLPKHFEAQDNIPFYEELKLPVGGGVVKITPQERALQHAKELSLANLVRVSYLGVTTFVPTRYVELITVEPIMETM